jgi:hypothetical protein
MSTFASKKRFVRERPCPFSNRRAFRIVPGSLPARPFAVRANL